VAVSSKTFPSSSRTLREARRQGMQVQVQARERDPMPMVSLVTFSRKCKSKRLVTGLTSLGSLQKLLMSAPGTHMSAERLEVL
jgi:hypothetical protein